MEYANPMRGPTFQLVFPFAAEVWNTVAPVWPTGFGALGSKVEKRLNSSVRLPWWSKRRPKVIVRLLRSLISSLAQIAPYRILGMYLKGSEKFALSTWPRMNDANSLP